MIIFLLVLVHSTSAFGFGLFGANNNCCPQTIGFVPPAGGCCPQQQQQQQPVTNNYYYLSDPNGQPTVAVSPTFPTRPFSPSFAPRPFSPSVAPEVIFQPVPSNQFELPASFGPRTRFQPVTSNQFPQSNQFESPANEDLYPHVPQYAYRDENRLAQAEQSRQIYLRNFRSRFSPIPSNQFEAPENDVFYPQYPPARINQRGFARLPYPMERLPSYVQQPLALRSEDDSYPPYYAQRQSVPEDDPLVSVPISYLRNGNSWRQNAPTDEYLSASSNNAFVPPPLRKQLGRPTRRETRFLNSGANVIPKNNIRDATTTGSTGGAGSY